MNKKLISFAVMVIFLSSCSKLFISSKNSSNNQTSQGVAAKDSNEILRKTLYFNTNSALIDDKDKASVKEDVKSIIESNKSIKIIAEGNCDERGTKSYNFKLGKKRAQAVKNILVSYGIKKSKISIISRGEDNPVAFGHDEDSWAKNRRVEIIILK